MHREAIQLGDGQPGFRDESVDLPVQVASTADHSLKRVQAVLPGRNLCIVAPAMLQKEEPAVRLENSTDFSECLDRIGNGTESPGADDAVEGSIAEGERFRADLLDLKGKGNGSTSLCHSLG